MGFEIQPALQACQPRSRGGHGLGALPGVQLGLQNPNSNRISKLTTAVYKVNTRVATDRIDKTGQLGLGWGTGGLAVGYRCGTTSRGTGGVRMGCGWAAKRETRNPDPGPVVNCPVMSRLIGLTSHSDIELQNFKQERLPVVVQGRLIDRNRKGKGKGKGNADRTRSRQCKPPTQTRDVNLQSTEPPAALQRRWGFDWPLGQEGRLCDTPLLTFKALKPTIADFKYDAVTSIDGSWDRSGCMARRFQTYPRSTKHAFA